MDLDPGCLNLKHQQGLSQLRCPVVQGHQFGSWKAVSHLPGAERATTSVPPQDSSDNKMSQTKARISMVLLGADHV